MTYGNYTPTYAEVVNYANEQGFLGKIETKKFYDYYAKSGFSYHGLPQDWKAKMHEWARRQRGPVQMTVMEYEILNPHAQQVEQAKSAYFGQIESLDELRRRVDAI